MKKIKIAASDEEIDACYPVMAELRPHLDRTAFMAQVKRQTQDSGFKLVYLTDGGGGEVRAVAGIRVAEWLAGGKYLEIEDLVAMDGQRSKGYGGELFDWIVEYAGRQECRQVKLVSHVTRFDAHRFYLNKRMKIEAHYFAMQMGPIA